MSTNVSPGGLGRRKSLSTEERKEEEEEEEEPTAQGKEGQKRQGRKTYRPTRAEKLHGRLLREIDKGSGDKN
jgi:hypothetical protein